MATTGKKVTPSAAYLAEMGFTPEQYEAAQRNTTPEEKRLRREYGKRLEERRYPGRTPEEAAEQQRRLAEMNGELDELRGWAKVLRKASEKNMKRGKIRAVEDSPN